MKKRLIFAALLVLLLAAVASAALAEKTMYVYTKNGKSLYVRSSMTTKEDNIRGSLPYGTKVTAYGDGSTGWYLIDYDDYGDSYVMARYLVSYKPAPFDPGKSEAPSSAGDELDTKAASTVVQMNTLVQSVRFVEPYAVTVRPSRASGWVYLRWFPSRNAESLATFSSDYQLNVVAELKDWYQVEDPQTGRTGFVYKSYIVR